jgi:oxygen-independent coproporphyrinogen-3 oxidase
MSQTVSLYLHIPFCTHRCAYCDFNTYADQEAAIPAYFAALIREIEFVTKNAPQPIQAHTIFFGGGTPTLAPPGELASIMQALRSSMSLAPNAEVTIEANPGTVSAASLARFREAGIDRISLGAQSARADELRQLERAHNFLDVIQAVSLARRAGFENINLDLIYGLPGQRPSTWLDTLRRVLDLDPDHISAYALSLERGTPFGRRAARGNFPLPDPDLAAEMYESAAEILSTHGYVHYEISNWAKPNRECRHNMQYWRSLPYLAFGAGAHGYADGYRYSNVLRIKTYIDRLAGAGAHAAPDYPFSPALVNRSRQSQADEITDYMLNNLRLLGRGVAFRDFESRFGSSPADLYAGEIRELVQAGLLEQGIFASEEAIRLTPRGRLLGNQVFLRFV